MSVMPVDYLDRLYVQGLYPECFGPCTDCMGVTMKNGNCVLCAGTGKVSVATIQGVLRGRKAREAA